jgi:hypothetical protein
MNTIFASNLKLEVGKLAPSPDEINIERESLNTAQPIFVLREATREEYIKSIGFEEPVHPDFQWYYECSTD